MDYKQKSVTSKVTDFVRSVADLNCCTRFCRPLPNRSANRPGCDFAVQR